MACMAATHAAPILAGIFVIAVSFKRCGISYDQTKIHYCNKTLLWALCMGLLMQYRDLSESEKEIIRARSRAQYHKNKETCKARNKKWRQDNAARIQENNKKYAAANPDKVLIWNQNKQLNQAATNAKHRKKIRNILFEILGARCVWCGYDWLPGLTFDHIYNDGAKDRKSKTVGIMDYYYKRPADAIRRLQTLCGGCNQAKGRYLARHRDLTGQIITREMVEHDG